MPIDEEGNYVPVKRKPGRPKRKAPKIGTKKWERKKRVAAKKKRLYLKKYLKKKRQLAKQAAAPAALERGKPIKKFRNFRSIFEFTISQELEQRGIKYIYEPHDLDYTLRLTDGGTRRHVCLDCGGRNVGFNGSYIPDFYLPDYDLYIETKGLLTPREKKKMVSVLERNPTKKIYMQFMYDNWNTKTKTTRYSDWAKKAKIPFGIGKDLWYLDGKDT